MVLRGLERQNSSAGNQGQDAQLLSLKTFFHDDLASRGQTEFLAHHDPVDGGQGLLSCRTNNDSLAAGQAVGFDDHRIFARFDVVPSRVGMVEDAELRGGHVGMAHELLGEHLAGFELGSLFRRPKDAQSHFLKTVDDAQGQGLFRSDHRQADLFLLGPFD